ncbi:alpha/beta hydrolase [Algoriphagus aestuariicola]|jgi:acetyl esterase/lipase|uniref:Alpha/beta hydrolase n=1 Tax=Algoriphagus aestuariicola TaxID=1852016 RepID=A0ABS3BUR6_9BACT|nr:alpha/beta hydrolase [Algoriphagus aestuariicola]MBN7802579.1 alpha/beta hydrolase [Algoriphagus aestuariicola]
MAKKLLLFILLGFIFSCSSDEPPVETPLPELELTNVSYGTGDKQQLDIYLPAGRNLAETPLILYIHGGGWIEGSKDEFLPFKSGMGILFPGYAYASMNYSLFNLATGDNPFPTQENDVISAIEFVESMSSEWDLEGGLVLVGASAGGHLALLHAYKHADIGNVKSVVAFFPPTELSELFTYSDPTAYLLSELLEGTPQSNPDLYNESSPISHITPSSVPTIFFHGDLDNVVPLSQSSLLEEALQDNGVTYQFQVVPGQGHGFTADTYPALLTMAAQFIKDNP